MLFGNEGEIGDGFGRSNDTPALDGAVAGEVDRDGGPGRSKRGF